MIIKLVSATLSKQIIRFLKYLCNTMSYICQSVELLSGFMEKPQECHLIAVKRVLRYIKCTINRGVLMSRKKKSNTNAEVYDYTNSIFSGDQNEKKSIVGYIFVIEGARISLSSRKQSIMVLSF